MESGLRRAERERALSLVDDGKVEKHEALEVVRDARAELQKDRPNKLRLRSLFSGLAQGMQMLDGVPTESIANPGHKGGLGVHRHFILAVTRHGV